MENTNQSSNKRFLAYVRVSSKDQARGTSLEEQKIQVEKYARQNDFTIERFYGETESASKTGRAIFDEMIKELGRNKYAGLIFHKVDRSARNPKDQALLYDLMIKGYELHFVVEGLNTTEPMGRNMIYLLWGMASGYSENLRMEINKGILGRLRQGRMPSYVPLGYKKAEECRAVFDPERAPLIKKMFELYATGRYSVKVLVKTMRGIGLRSRKGNLINMTRIHELLRNPFYYGIIRHHKGIFQGEHQPLISKRLFDKVQYYLKKKGFKCKFTHDYIFRDKLKCWKCGLPMRVMTSKQRWQYYYCRNTDCEIKTVPETRLNQMMIERLKEIELADEEVESFKKALIAFKGQVEQSKAEQMKAINLQISSLDSRLDGLLQKYIDEKVDDETYRKTRESLLNKKLELQENRGAIDRADSNKFTQLEELGKLLKSPVIAYQNADLVGKTKLLDSLVENFDLQPKNLYVTWKKPFDLVANREKQKSCGDADIETGCKYGLEMFLRGLVGFVCLGFYSLNQQNKKKPEPLLVGITPKQLVIPKSGLLQSVLPTDERKMIVT